MYKILNQHTSEIVHESSDYDEAVKYMQELNGTFHRTRIARNWFNNQERELYKDTNGKVSYGTYIIQSE